MSEETAGSSIGTARIDMVVNSSTWDTSISGTKSKISEFSQSAQDAYSRLDAAQKKATDSAIKQAAAFGKTRDQIVLMNAAAKGVPTAILDELAGNMSKVSAATTGAGHAVEEFSLNNSNARRELGRLASDLANGNYGRFQQTFLTLANYSGVLGKVFSGTGLAIGGAVAVLGAFVTAAAQSYEEAQKLNEAIAQTGGSAGQSVATIDKLSASLATTQITGGKVKDTLLLLAANGKVSAQSFDAFSQAAVNMEALTGDSADKAAASVVAMFDGTVEGALKANEQYHFLTAGVIDHIAALQKQNDAQGAVNAELDAFNQAAQPRLAELSDSTYGLAKAWNSVWDNIKGAYGSFKDYASLKLGTADLQVQLDAVNARLTSEQSLVDKIIHPRDSDTALRDSLQAQIDERNNNAAKDAHAASVNQAGSVGEAGLQATIRAGESNEDKRKDALIQARQQANAAITAARLKGDQQLVAQDQADYLKAVASINAQYDKKIPKASKEDPFAGLNGLVQKAQVQDNNFGLGDGKQSKQVTDILEIVDAGAKLIATGHDVATVQKDVATGVTSLNDLYAKEAAQLHDKNVVALDAYRAAMDKQNAALQMQVNNEVARIGMGDKEYQQQQQINKAYQDQADRLEQVAIKQKEFASTGGTSGLSAADAAAMTATIQDETNKRVAIVRAGFMQMDAAQADWTNGAIAAMQNWADQGADVAGQTKSIFTDAFGNMTDAVVTFETTGKISIKSFVTSALTDFARMETRIAESKILQSILGAFLGSGSQTSYNLDGSLASDGSNGFGVGGGTYSLAGSRANGGQVNPGSLYQVNEKGPELLTTAGKTYLMMGAAGGAVIPSGQAARMPAPANGGGNVFNFTSNTTVNSDGTAQTQTTGDSRSALGKQLNDQMTQAAQGVLMKAVRPGGLLWRQQNGR